MRHCVYTEFPRLRRRCRARKNGWNTYTRTTGTRYNETWRICRTGLRALTCQVRPDNEAVLPTIRRAELHARVSAADGLTVYRVPVDDCPYDASATNLVAHHVAVLQRQAQPVERAPRQDAPPVVERRPEPPAPEAEAQADEADETATLLNGAAASIEARDALLASLAVATDRKSATALSSEIRNRCFLNVFDNISHLLFDRPGRPFDLSHSDNRPFVVTC